MNVMTDGKHRDDNVNKAMESMNTTTKNIILKHFKQSGSCCTNHNNIHGEVAGSGRVGSTMLFSGVAVAIERMACHHF